MSRTPSRASRRALLLSAALAAAGAAAAISSVGALAGASARAASSHTITLRDVRFHPGKLSINQGESVRWVWADGEEHNVTFHGFHSRTMAHGSYTVRFTQAGTFNYSCTIHVSEGMKGKIVVH
jgi:plastocyanin